MALTGHPFPTNQQPLPESNDRQQSGRDFASGLIINIHLRRS